MGGETFFSFGRRMPLMGSSPRGRGNRPAGTEATEGVGFIPAWAGKPWGVDAFERDQTVHPRVGGETTMSIGRSMSGMGSSPRGRGNLSPYDPVLGPPGFIPAWAGKPGDRFISGRLSEGSSPRGRGNLPYSVPDALWLRFIPAWAGKPGRRFAPDPRCRVHPRVGGETVRAAEYLAT